jgi:hypothetical protein
VDWALMYAAHGFVVMPLRRLGNEPHGVLGKFGELGGFKTVGSTNEDQIRAWWAQDPAANIGIVTGSRSGVLVLDVDMKRVDGWSELRRWMLETGTALPFQTTSRTPSGGGHIWFRLPDREVRTKKIGWLPGVDACLDGCEVAVPPSIKDVSVRDPKVQAPSFILRREYEWVRTGEMPPAPPGLLEDIAARPATIVTKEGERRTYSGDVPKPEWFIEYGFGHVLGSRNVEVHKVACRLFVKYEGNKTRVLETIRKAYLADGTDRTDFTWDEVEYTVGSAENWYRNRREDWTKLIVIPPGWRRQMEAGR